MKKILLFSIALVIGFFISSNTAKAQSGNNSNVNTPLISVQAASINTAQTQNGEAPSGGQTAGANITVTANPGSTGGLDLGGLDRQVAEPGNPQIVTFRTIVRAISISASESNTLITALRASIVSLRAQAFANLSLN